MSAKKIDPKEIDPEKVKKLKSKEKIGIFGQPKAKTMFGQKLKDQDK